MTPAQFRSWRAIAGLTQPEAARLLGKSDKTVRRYEAGQSAIPDEVAAKALTIKGPAAGEDYPFITPASHPKLYRRERGRYYVTREHPGFVKKSPAARYNVRVSELAAYVPPPEEPAEPSMAEWLAKMTGE